MSFPFFTFQELEDEILVDNDVYLLAAFFFSTSRFPVLFNLNTYSMPLNLLYMYVKPIIKRAH